MSLRKLGVVLFAALALSALAVSSASAAAKTESNPETKTGQWFTGSPGVTLPVGSTKTITASLNGDPEVGTMATLQSSAAGQPLDLTATGLECLSCTIANKVAKSNAEVNTSANVVATGTGKLKFTGVTVREPANCTVAGGSITTNQLNVHADFMNGTTAVQEFFPAAKGSKTFASFTIEGTSCPVAGTYLVQGTVFTDAVTISEPKVDEFKEAKKETGKTGKVQQVRTSPTIQTADGGSLTLSGSPAKLFATANLKLSPEEEFEIK